MTVPAQVLAAVRSIPYPRQEPDMSAPAPSPAEQAVIERFEVTSPAPEAHDPAIWDILCDLLPCNEMAECLDECECTAGEIRLAIQRLITAERIHLADCGETLDCCDNSHALAMRVEALALTNTR